MRVAFPYINEPIYFGEDKIRLLVIENKQYFRNAIMQLSCGNKEETFVFSKDYKTLDFGTDCVFIADPLNAEANDRKLMTRLNNKIIQFANERHMDELAQIVQMLYELGQGLCKDMDFDVTFNYETDAPSLVKFMSFKPALQEERSELEKLLIMLKLYRQYLGIKIFTVANLFLYFSDNELEILFSDLRKAEIHLLVLENNVPANRNGVEMCIIDNELCEIR